MSTLRRFLSEAADSYRLLITVLALNVPLVMVFTMANLAGRGLAWTNWLYAAAVAVGYYCLPLLLVVSVAFLLSVPARRAVIPIGVAIVTIFVTYLLLDSLAYRIVKFHINPFWIEFAVRDAAGLGLPSSTWLAVLAVLLGVGLAEFGLVALARRLRSRRLVIAFPVVTVLAFASSQIVHIVAYEWNDPHITSLTPHFPLYAPITSHKNASTYRDMMPWVDAQAAVEGVDGDQASLRYPIAEPRFDATRAQDPPNIVFILLESWRADSMNETVSPNIAALGRRSTVFLDHMSSGNQTTCGVFGLFYGLHATYWTAVKANSAEIDNPVLIDVMKSRGYAFGVFAKSNFERHKIKDTVFSGIDVHESFAGRSNVEQDADLTRQMIQFMAEQAEQKRPFFALAFYKSTHAPYEYPPDHEIFGDTRKVPMGFTGAGTDPAPHLRRYWDAVNYVDSLVGEVIQHLEALGLLDHTVVVITSDHGESFNDNGSNYWGHGSNYTQFQTRVPLIFHDPGRPPQRVTRRTAHIDIVPTILEDNFGCTSDASVYSNGHNLFDPTAGTRALVIGSYVNHAYVFGDDVYEVQPMRTKKYKIYDVNADAGTPDPETMKALAQEIQRFADG